MLYVISTPTEFEIVKTIVLSHCPWGCRFIYRQGGAQTMSGQKRQTQPKATPRNVIK